MEILSLGEKIKRRRKELDLTLKDVAGERITPGQISLVESGKSNPSMDLLEYLADALHTSVEYLMESEETQADKVCGFFQSMAEAYILEKDLIKGEEFIEKAVYYAEKYSLENKKAKNLYLRGTIYMIKEEFGQAQQFYLSANVIFIKNNMYEEVVNTFLNLGKITINQSSYHSAFSYFQQAEKVFIDNSVGDDFLLAQLYYYIAFTYFKLENIDKSINYCYLAKEKFIQIDNKEEYVRTLLLLAQEYSIKGDLDSAVEYSKRTLKILKEINNDIYMSEIENSLGRLFYEFENIEESFNHLNKARELRRKNKDPKLLETLTNLCENYIKIKEITGAKEVLEEIMNCINEGSEDALLEYYLLKYRVNMLEGEAEEAESTLILALNFAKSMEYTKKYGEINIMLGKLYIDIRNEAEAAKYLNAGVNVFKELGIIKEL